MMLFKVWEGKFNQKFKNSLFSKRSFLILSFKKHLPHHSYLSHLLFCLCIYHLYATHSIFFLLLDDYISLSLPDSQEFILLLLEFVTTYWRSCHMIGVQWMLAKWMGQWIQESCSIGLIHFDAFGKHNIVKVKVIK